MNLKNLVQQMDALVSRGEMVSAIETYFSEEAKTSDYASVKTDGKQQMLDKMKGFMEAIANVNEISHHRTLVDGDCSASEFTFDFDMKDGSNIHWHEIIRRVWKDNLVVEEEYFNASNTH